MAVFLGYSATPIVSAGTWTTLLTDLSPFRLAPQTTTAAGTASMNVPTLTNIQAGDFFTPSNTNPKNNVPPEAFEMIELIQKGYASGGNVLSFWSAAALLRAWLNGIFDGQVATTPTITTGALSV